MSKAATYPAREPAEMQKNSPKKQLSSVRKQPTEKKLSCARWRPLTSSLRNDPVGDLRLDLVATGSWGQNVNEVCLRNFKAQQRGLRREDGTKKPGQSAEDKILFSLPHKGDVQDIQFKSADVFYSCSSLGDVTEFRIDEKNKLVPLQQERQVRLHSGPATTLACQPRGDIFATGGEDDTINFVAASRMQVVGKIRVQSPTTTMIRFVGPNFFFVSGSGGKLQGFDLRQCGKKEVQGKRARPNVCCQSTGSTVTSFCYHPSQPHILASGSSTGVVSIWDVRRVPTKPTIAEEVHSGAVWDLMFLPHASTALISCGEDGILQLLDLNKHGSDYQSDNFWSDGGMKNNLESTCLYRDGLSLNKLEPGRAGTIGSELSGSSLGPANTILCTSDTQSLISFQHFPVWSDSKSDSSMYDMR